MAESLEKVLRASLARFEDMGMKRDAAATRDWTTPALQTLLLRHHPDVAAHSLAAVKPDNTFFHLTVRLIREMFGGEQADAGSDYRLTLKSERRRHLTISSSTTKLWINLQVSAIPPLTRHTPTL